MCKYKWTSRAAENKQAVNYWGKRRKGEEGEGGKERKGREEGRGRGGREKRRRKVGGQHIATPLTFLEGERWSSSTDKVFTSSFLFASLGHKTNSISYAPDYLQVSSCVLPAQMT